MSNISRKDFTFLSSDAVHNINCFAIYPDNPKAILQIEHGVAEHIERYVPFAEKMAEQGFAVFADDHLGHGKSFTNQDEMCWFAENDGWHLICEDVVKLRKIATDMFPEIPFILMGHSMGSFIARTVAIDHSDLIDALVLSGTGHQSGLIIGLGKTVARFEKGRLGTSKGRSNIIENLAFGAYNKKFAPNRTTHDWLSRDEKEVDKYIADPLSGSNVSVGLFYDMLSGLDYIRRPKNISKIRKDLPIYIFSGDKDPVGDMGKGVKTVYNLYLGSEIKDVSLKLYPEGRHELLNGPDREQVTVELTNWLNNKIQE